MTKSFSDKVSGDMIIISIRRKVHFRIFNSPKSLDDCKVTFYFSEIGLVFKLETWYKSGLLLWESIAFEAPIN